MSRTFSTLIIASCATALGAVDAAASEYLCRKQDSSLRIAVEVKKEGHTLPCEVIAEDDRGERAVLYSAQYDRNYCPSRIEKTKGELEQEGWRCEMTSETNVVADQEPADEDVAQAQPVESAENGVGGPATPAAADGKTVAASHQCRQGDLVRHIRIEVENPSSGKPCELIYWADGDRSRPGELLWRAEHDANFCPRRLDRIIARWSGEGWSCESDGIETAAVDLSESTGDAEAAAETETVPAPDVDAARLPADEESAAVPAPNGDPTLEAVIAADAERIGEWMDVEPAIEIAARGDLNDDGSDDAVVFLAYQSDQAAYRQYLMSYLVAEDGYELASVKLLTGVGPPPEQARVEEIDEGVIWLTVPDGDGGSTEEPTGYRLRDQQLVQVAPEDGDANAN